MQVNPRWRLSFRKRPCGGFGQAKARQPMASRTGGHVKAWAEAIDDSDGHHLGDVAPALPAMEAAQNVGAHDPNEMHAGAAPDQISDGLVGVTGAELGFEVSDVDARMVRQSARGSKARGERGKAARVLERIAGCDQPPHAIETEPLHGEQAGGAVRRVWRIEGAAEQPDAHAG